MEARAKGKGDKPRGKDWESGRGEETRAKSKGTTAGRKGWRSKAKTLRGRPQGTGEIHAARCDDSRSTVRWRSQRAALAIAARCVDRPAQAERKGQRSAPVCPSDCSGKCTALPPPWQASESLCPHAQQPAGTHPCLCAPPYTAATPARSWVPGWLHRACALWGNDLLEGRPHLRHPTACLWPSGARQRARVRTGAT